MDSENREKTKQISIQRVNYFLGLEKNENSVLTLEETKYGMGNEISIPEWEAKVGVNLRAQTITEKAKAGGHLESSFMDSFLSSLANLMK